MKKKNGARTRSAQPEARRLAEIDALSRDIRRTLSQMRRALRSDTQASVKDVTTKLNELHAAHLKVLAAEDAFHAKIGKSPDQDAIDYDRISAEIGRQLDRIRDSILPE